MQIKSKQMEFTNKQNDQLKQIKDMSKFCKIKEKCDNLKRELEKLKSAKSDCLREREVLMESMVSLYEELKTSREKECSLQAKLEEIDLIDNDGEDHLQTLCLLFGYTILKRQILENKSLQITLGYRDICYVTYNETCNMFDLIQIYPQHLNFHQIKEFLLNSQDLRGLLSCLRQFFDFALECKEKDNQ